MGTTHDLPGTDVVEHLLAPGVLQITLNRQQVKNALRASTWIELVDALDGAATNREVRVIVMSGEGGAFSSGADLADNTALARGPIAGLRMANAAARALHELPKPTIAMVRGVAVGGGASLALGCDFVLAERSATFRQIFVRRALTLDCGASWLLPRLIGLRRATELAFLGDDLPATEATRIGLINDAVDADELVPATIALADRLARLPGDALALTKSLLHGAVGPNMTDALDGELRGQACALVSKDFREAVRAFRDRREPVWTS
jgi:2-(1,2-epoxy-1,2-dihydrophenyl)acetyl-CoA isomerase